jgi:hypothetical protein
MQPDNQAPAAGLGPPPLNQAQQRTLERLLTPPWELPTHPENLADAMRGRLERDLSVSPAVLQAKKTVFSKNDLSSVLCCEDYHLVNKNTFEWTPVTARGTLTHKAIQLGAFGRLAKEGPGEWVEAAFDYFESGWTRPTELGAWLERDCTPAQRSELEGEAVDRATKFQQTFPTLVRAWAPRFESPAKAELLGGNVVLRGKFDLALTLRQGQPGSSVIIDFKTGPVHQSHRDDLRFYALLETMRAGVPPWRVATFDLDSATFVHEDVTDDVLEAALARTVRGVTLCAELWLENRVASRTPGAQCRWCELNQDCSVAWPEGRPPDDE